MSEPIVEYNVGTKKETDKKCPSCGGVMDFSPSTGKMVCPYCGYEEAIKVADERFVAEEIDFSRAEDAALNNWGTATKTVLCKSCGAETVYDTNTIAGECPYCGSNQVMEEKGKDTMAPGGVVTFAIDQAKAGELFKKWIGGKFFVPAAAKESAKPKNFKGLYIPFWTFDTQTNSSYTGQYGIKRKVKKEDGKEETVTDWFNTAGRHAQFFDDVLICGSTQQSESAMHALEPFDTKKAVAYKPEYMAGFTAERYTLNPKSAWEKAKERIKDIIIDNVCSKIRKEKKADDTKDVVVNTNYSKTTFKYLLLPVWISSYTYNGKVYQFWVNGQTGKVSGDAPFAKAKLFIIIAAIVGIFAAIHFLTGNNAQAAMLMPPIM